MKGFLIIICSVLCTTAGWFSGYGSAMHKLKNDPTFLVKTLMEMSKEPEGFVRMKPVKYMGHKEEL